MAKSFMGATKATIFTDLYPNEIKNVLRGAGFEKKQIDAFYRSAARDGKAPRVHFSNRCKEVFEFLKVNI